MTERHYSKNGHHPDYFILGIVALLVLLGLVMLTSASSHLGKIRFNDPYYYVKSQVLKGLLIGLLGFFIASKVHYRHLKKMALPILLLSLGLLFMVFTPFGVASGGAERWVAFGPITFQPAEIMKIAYIVYLAAWISNHKINRRKNIYEGLIPFLIVSGLVGGVLIKQPATSTVVILLGAGLIVYFLSGAPWKFIGASVLLGLLMLVVLVTITPYRLERVMGFLSRGSDTQGSGYHLNQALIAIGSGQVFGVGYGDSISKVKFLPDPIADSVFAVIAEELGFIGGALLVILFALLTLRILWLAKKSRDGFAQAILVGFAVIIGGQAFMHMASISGVLPLTGVPLPFISFGGTALAVFLTMAGIITNISRYA